MNDTHPTADQLDRYRRRASSSAELLDVDAHIATCDRCFNVVRAGATNVVLLPVPHLTYAESEKFVDGRADAVDREVVESHIATCEQCRAEVADLSRVRDSVRSTSRPARLRWLATAAALLAFVLGGAWLSRRENVTSTTPPPVVQTASAEPAPQAVPERIVTLIKPPIVDTLQREQRVLRGGSSRNPFALQAPIATVVLDDRPRFRWTAAKNVQSYDVAVADAESGNVAATGSSDATWWRPDMPLPRGRTYSWQVTAHIGSDTVVIPGPSGAETLFHVASSDVAAEIEKQKTHLDRGVALAQHGVLDDAEAELQLAAAEGDARATHFLEQVRSWRGDGYRVLPMTTNGAQ